MNTTSINTYAFNELTDEELINVEGGLVPLLMFGLAVCGGALKYRDEIASGLVDGWYSVMGY